MSIKVKCDKCNTIYNLKDELAGKKVKCSKCQNTIQVLDKVKDEKNLQEEIDSFDLDKNESDISKDKLSIKAKLFILINVLIIIYSIKSLLSSNLSNSLLFVYISIITPLLNLYIFIKILNKSRSNNLSITEKIITIISGFSNIIIVVFFTFGVLYKWKNFIYSLNSDLIFLLFYIFTSIYYLYLFYKSNIYKKDTYKILISKILKILKWIFIVFIVGFIILLITIYISSLSSYKESDFNIPKDFFNTKFYDKDPLSKDNGFKDLVIFNEGFVRNKDIYTDQVRISKNNYLDKDINLEYISTLSNCIFKDKIENKPSIYTKEYCKTELNRILNKELEVHDKQIDIEINLLGINENDKKQKLIQQKYIKFNGYETKIIKTFYSYFNIKDIDKKLNELNNKLNTIKSTDKDYYKVFDYINTKKTYEKYKIFLDNIKSIDNNIKTIADIGKIIKDINNGVKVDNKLKKVIVGELYKWNLSLKDFNNYDNELIILKDIGKKYKLKIIQKFKDFVLSNSKKLENINNKKYILPYSTTSPFGNYYLNSSYFLSIRYISYIYFKKGEYQKGIQILLDYQKFIDNLIVKGDFSDNSNYILMFISNNYINSLNYFIDNYNLSNSLKNNIINSLGEYGHNLLINNFGYKWDYKLYKESVDYFIKNYDKLSFFEKIELKFFYSYSETTLLNKKMFYESVINKLKKSDFNFKLNINNYGGRYLIKRLYRGDSHYELNKEKEKIYKLRKKTLEKLRKSIEDSKVLNENTTSKKNVNDKNLNNSKNSDNKILGNGFKLNFNLNNKELIYDKVKSLDKGIFVLFHGNRGNDGGIVFIDKITGNQKMLFRNTNYQTTDDKYLEIINFAVVKNNDVYIFYKGKNLEKKVKVIKSKDF